MSNKTNVAFLKAYIELDNVCCDKLGASRGGLTDYINRLISQRSIPDRNEILPVLVRYRNIRNRMAHETDALKHIKEVSASDVRWIKSFSKDVSRGRDPLSRYYKRMESRKKWSKIRMILVPVLALVVIAAAFAVLKILNII